MVWHSIMIYGSHIFFPSLSISTLFVGMWDDLMPPWFDWSAPNKSSIFYMEKRAVVQSAVSLWPYWRTWYDTTEQYKWNSGFFSGTYPVEQYYVDNLYNLYISHRQSVHLQRFETATAAREAICGAGPLVCRCCPKPSPGRMEGGEGEGRRCIVRRVAGESNPGGRITRAEHSIIRGAE